MRLKLFLNPEQDENLESTSLYEASISGPLSFMNTAQGQDEDTGDGKDKEGKTDDGELDEYRGIHM
jgi:hypothetical protein